MGTESLLSSGGDTSEKDPAPAGKEDHFRERVLGSDLRVMDGDFMGFDENNLGESDLDQIHKTASSVLESFSLMWEEIDERCTSLEGLLKERAMELELKERSVMERTLELKKKEEEVEERERKIGLLEKSMLLRLEKKEQEIDMKQYLVSSVVRLVCEKASEEVTNKLEERRKEVERLSKLNDDKSCELERTVLHEFDLKQKESNERWSKEAELVRESLKQLKLREKELSLLDEAIKEKASELEKKEEIFEAEKKAKAEELEWKSEFLHVKEKKLEKREDELDFKLMELEQRTIQAETWKRSRGKLLAQKVREADSHIRPFKRHKSLREHMHGDEDMGIDSASASPPVQISEAHERDIIEFVSINDIDDEDPEPIMCSDSEFHDYSKTMSSFVVGKVWALYDPIDEMPRLYGRIKKINKSRSSLQVTWLEPKDEDSVPVACGRFTYGATETLSHSTFSHEMQPIIHGKNFIAVNPRQGETWALFRDWSQSWNNNPEQHKPPYRYDFVEVLFDFEDHRGVGVAYLGKVKGFTSVFEQAEHNGVCQRVINLEEMYRFSHRVPSFRLSGEEKEGVPAGSFELDPAAVVDHSIYEEAEETERQSNDCGEGLELALQDDPFIILD
ncbi:hypothetical protein EUTSA_v10020307mg [Eutrema salsugineum]|uniref:DUF3444 domain-containing protein n=1 Tax=Eutrema salsugineum TaxID=72664 RepID=V4M0G6_EUTSA|nr:uncharacterized protein LOC18024420 [Eutrema salsugineum]ESQ49564.1 hypothetical protein EUTSA_v10020307mg [Eutrema salsugineum]